MNNYLTIAGVVYAAVPIGLTLWWRPGRRRLGALLCGTVVAAMLGTAIEAVAHRERLWQYTIDSDTPIGPLMFYPLGMANFFAIGLIAWRIGRRWGPRGQAAFLAIITVTGPVRDYFEADRWLHVLRFGSGILPIALDLFAWFAPLAIIMVASEKIAGPSAVDLADDAAC